MKNALRIFLPLALVLSGCSVDDVTGLVDDAMVNARIGVLANTEIGWITETKMLEKALLFYRQSKVDAVVITGQVTKDGYKDQFAVLDRVWAKVFGRDGKTRLIIKDGRYEVNGFVFAVTAKRVVADPDVLTFHGEGKLALTEELCHYPHESRLVNAGSMHGVTVFGGIGDDPELANRLAKAAQGLLVSVYSDTVEIRRLDFTMKGPVDPDSSRRGRRKKKADGLVYAEDVAEPWVIGKEAEKVPPPRFWEDTRIFVSAGLEKGKTVYIVRWPAVRKRLTGARARCYDVVVAYADAPDRPLLTRRVFSGLFHLSEERERNGVRCSFPASDLPRKTAEHSAIVFAVTPIGVFGRRGDPVVSDPVPLQ